MGICSGGEGTPPAISCLGFHALLGVPYTAALVCKQCVAPMQTAARVLGEARREPQCSGV